MENQIEQKQLDWETKQIQLESLDEVPNDLDIGLISLLPVIIEKLYHIQI